MYQIAYQQTNPALIIPAEPMTAADRIELAECENVIQSHINAYIEVGTALLTIREKRLYRELYATFEDYTRERWQIASRQLAAQNILAAQVANRLSRTLDVSGLKITHALEMRNLPDVTDQELADIYTLMKQTAPDGVVTTRHIRGVSEVVKEVMATGAIDNGDGVSIPAVGAFTAAVHDEVYERVMRQREHMSAKRGRRLAVDTVTVREKSEPLDGYYVMVRVSPQMFDALNVGQIVKVIVYEVEAE